MNFVHMAAFTCSVALAIAGPASAESKGETGPSPREEQVCSADRAVAATLESITRKTGRYLRQCVSVEGYLDGNLSQICNRHRNRCVALESGIESVWDKVRPTHSLEPIYIYGWLNTCENIRAEIAAMYPDGSVQDAGYCHVGGGLVIEVADAKFTR